MKVAVFSTKSYDRQFFTAAAVDSGPPLTFLEPRLTRETVVLAGGHDAVCVFVHDEVDADVLEGLAAAGVRLVAIRAAGYNNVDLESAKGLGITVARVPAYSPAGVAEFTVGLMLSLNRKIHRAYARVRRSDFSLDGLMGFNMGGKTAGIVGTGKIGQSVAQILLGFGCRVVAFDLAEAPSLTERGVEYRSLDELWKISDMVTLHVPLLKATHHLVNRDTIARMKPGVMLINTSRGELIDTGAAIGGLKSGQIGSLGIDVYEDEEGVFFEDLSNSVVADDKLMRLTTFPNVILTSHQAFFTREAMANIARVTIDNLKMFAERGTCSGDSLL